MITDLWGDAPYPRPLRGDEGAEFFDAAFDNKEIFILGILARI